MTTLKQGTKRAFALIGNYDSTIAYHGYRDLYDCYTTPSPTKKAIYDSIRKECYDELNGYGLAVLSTNCFQFTVGFLYPDKETGAIKLRVYTRDNCYETWYI